MRSAYFAMDIPLTQRLSFKQARLAVLVAFILGTLLSLGQVGVDYASENASINREIQALLKISHHPAARIAYNIDSELAQELVTGLLRSEAITHAEILDNSGAILASASRPTARSEYRVLSDFLFGERREFDDLLYLDHAPDEALGRLRLEVDTFIFGNHFLRRASLTLLAGFARTLLLTAFLLVLFYFMLTKPLNGIINAISERDLRLPRRQKLACPVGHEQDEIGILVRVTNRQLDSIADEMQQREDAEERLTKHLGELENSVLARTAELEAANRHLIRTNRELDAARQQAQQMAQARSSFLANMSHEIRTPLNGLLGMLELAMDGPLNTEQRQQLFIAHDSGKILVALLNDILDLSKFEAGQLELERIPLDLGGLVEDTARLFSQSAAADVELTCLVDPLFPSRVLGDSTRVRQIISNLLSNALKFTRTGRVDVSLKASASSVLLVIRDSGIGIAEPLQKRIFQPFSQAGADIAREFGGTGLGLALTLRLCEAMDGRLSLESEEGEGSKFQVELPLPIFSPAASLPPLHGRVIAVCTASSGLAQLLEMHLPIWGLDYQRHDRISAASLAETELIITDAPQLLAQLREASARPLLLVTAYNSYLSPQQAQQLAPFEQLPRPLSRAGLHSALGRLLQREESGLRLEPAMPSIRQDPFQVLLVEDNPVNQLVVKGMLHKLGYQVTVAANGSEALASLNERSADLVLMDCNMPVLDGYQTSRRIRQDGRWTQLPIIALTANALADEPERCRAAGMNDYLAKPLLRDALAAVLAKWLPGAKAESAAADFPDAPATH